MSETISFDQFLKTVDALGVDAQTRDWVIRTGSIEAAWQQSILPRWMTCVLARRVDPRGLVRSIDGVTLGIIKPFVPDYATACPERLDATNEVSEFSTFDVDRRLQAVIAEDVAMRAAGYSMSPAALRALRQLGANAARTALVQAWNSACHVGKLAAALAEQMAPGGYERLLGRWSAAAGRLADCLGRGMSSVERLAAAGADEAEARRTVREAFVGKIREAYPAIPNELLIPDHAELEEGR